MTFRALIPLALIYSLSGALPAVAASPQTADASANSSQSSGSKPPQQPIHPPKDLGIWLVGVHPMAEDVSKQWVAHHLCHQLKPDLMQCALYDSNKPGAKLTGIEYIVPDDRFDQLPEEEKQYWHPHNFEILGGTLVAPEVPDDMAILAGKMNSYGKTFHMWMTGTVTGESEDFPYGAPTLAWSLNKEGQLAAELKQAYQEMGYDIDANQQKRQSYVDEAEPQCGVNALDGRFEGETTPIEGVQAKQQGCPEYPFAR